MFKCFLVISILSVSALLSGAEAAPDNAQNAEYQEAHQPYNDCMARAVGREADRCADLQLQVGSLPEDPAAPAAAPPGAATAEEIQEAVQHYVIPTSTRNFSLSNLNSQNEASLIISSGNEENNVIFRVIRLISMLVGTVAILLYIVAGYFMIFSQGDDNSLTKGKQIITFTSLGLVIVFGAYMIVQLLMGLIYFTS